MSDPLDYDRLAGDYSKHRTVNPDVVRRLVASLTPASRVLEIGCGTGNYSRAIQDPVGCECIGIDPSAAMLAEVAGPGGRIPVCLARAEALPFDAGGFDFVFSVDVIHHVTDRDATYREALRVLRPGGKVCTITDSEWVIRNREPLSSYFPDSAEIDLTRYPRIEELKAAMESAGFEGLNEELAEWRYELTDSGPYRDRAFSSLQLLAEDSFRKGLRRLEADLAGGPIPCTSRYTLLWGGKSITRSADLGGPS